MSELSDQLPDRIAYATDAIADAFERAWRHGERPSIANFVDQADSESRLAVLLELLKIDAEYRFRAGDKPTIGQYVERFPELQNAGAEVLAELSFHLKCAAQRNPAATCSEVPQDASPGVSLSSCSRCGQPLPHDSLASPEAICAACKNRFRRHSESVCSEQSQGLPRWLGRFRLLELVGVGAFGSVYRAEDPELGRIVAIKYPRAAFVATPEECDRLVHEARSAAALHHPGIVPVYEIAHDGVTPFIVCEYISGCTLADHIRGPSLSSRTAAMLISKVAEALHFAHENGIIHRDIKPSNILLDESEQPFLCDFGLARGDTGDVLLTSDGEVAGTPAYMSPEQASGDPVAVGRQSDVYSLGVILYQMLTGERPFRGSARMLLPQVLYNEPVPPRSLNDQIPRDLESICLKAMSKISSRRYQTAAELVDDLKRFLNGKPTVARAVTSLERAALWVRRSPTLSALIAVSSLAVIGFVVALAFRARALTLHAIEVNAAVMEARSQRQRAEVGEQQARQISYLSDMKLAFQYWADRRLSEVTPILERQSQSGKHDDLRGLEWRLLRHAVQRDQTVIGTHSGAALEVATSRDGQTIASVGTDGKLRIWRCSRHSQPRTIDVQDDGIYSLAVSPDGSRIAVGSSSDLFEKSQVWLYDTSTGRRVAELQQHETNIESIRFSHDGMLLASAGRNDAIRIWSFRDESLRIIPSRSWHESLQFSPDDRFLAGQRPESFLTVWDCETLEVVHEIDNEYRPFWLTWSPLNDWIAYTASPLSEVEFIDSQTGERMACVSSGHTVPISAMTFTASGESLLLGFTDGTVTRWKITAPKTDADTRSNRLMVEANARPQTVLNGAISCFANIDDHRTAVTATDGTVAVIGNVPEKLFESSEVLAVRNGVAECSPDGSLLAVGAGNGQLQLRDIRSGARLHASKPSESHITDVAFARSRPLVAAARTSGRIVVWSYSDNGLEIVTELESTTPDKDEYPPSQVVFTPDATRLVSADFDDHGLRIWNIESGNPERTLETRFCCRNATVSPNGSWVATGHDFAYVWDLVTGKELFTLKDGDFITTLIFTADSRFLITGHRDGSIRVREMPTGRLHDLVAGHHDAVIGMAVTDDGRRLLSGDRRGNVRVWSLEHHEAFGILHAGLPPDTELRRLTLDPTTGDIYVGYSGIQSVCSLLVLRAAPLTRVSPKNDRPDFLQEQ